MPRLRCSREEAKLEAIRIAEEFVARRPDAHNHRILGAHPDDDAHQVGSGKTPAVWIVTFQWHIPGCTMDGGELFVRVNVQKRHAELRECEF